MSRANLDRRASVSTRMAMVQLSRGRRFDPETGEVVVGHRVTRLEPQPAALLALLAARPGVLVSHEELRQRLWSDGRHVDYTAGLHYAVRQIRRALGEGADDIETLPRRGYRLRDGALRPATPPAVSGAARDGHLPDRRAPDRRAAITVWITAAALTVGLVALVERRPNDHHARVVTVLRAVHGVLY